MTESEPDTPLAQSNQDPAAPPAEAAGAGGAVPAPVAAKPSMEDQLATTRTEAAANYDRYLRAVADLENYRRRVVREKEEQRQFAIVNLVQHLLPVLDNLQLGLTAARPQGDAKTIADGVAMVLGQLKDVLNRHGLAEVNPAGQRFDPHRHESLSHQPSAAVPEEHVLQVVRAGYTLHGRLLRPASVILSSGPAKEAK